MRKLLIVSLVALSIPSFALALTPAGGACSKDSKTFCKDVKPGKGRMLACLKTNMDKLSPDCKKQTAEWPKAKLAAKHHPAAKGSK